MPTVAVAAVLGIGGVAAAAALSGGGSSHPTPAPARSTPSSTPSVAPSSASPSGPVPAAATPASPAAALPDFSLSVVRRVSWIEVLGPRGQVLYRGLLRSGHTLVYKQRPLQVTIGDAGVVRIVAHHHALPGRRRGTVLRFTYS